MSLGIGHWKCPSEFRKPLNEHFRTMQGWIRLGKWLRMASDATKSIFWGHAWLGKCPQLVSDAVFEERATQNDEKAVTESYPRGSKNTRKHVVFVTFLKKKGRAQCTLDNTETQKMHENAWFTMNFETRTPPASSRKPFGPTSRLKKNQNLRFGSPETPTRFASTCKKTRENAWFLQCFTKIE